ncbi:MULTISPECIES: hypothetical protein [unclassified Nostoc]|nr:hypothetical protein [Nostoc sp. 'Peltigera membranacea cyanobiont' 232]
MGSTIAGVYADRRRNCTDGLCCNLGVQKKKPNLSTCIVNVAIA